jgi:hypothetical protein
VKYIIGMEIIKITLFQTFGLFARNAIKNFLEHRPNDVLINIGDKLYFGVFKRGAAPLL